MSTVCDSETLPPSFRARCHSWGRAGSPALERTGLARLLPELVSVWFNLDAPGAAVVCGDLCEPAVARLPESCDPLRFFGPSLAQASRACGECGSRTVLLLGVRGGTRIAASVDRGADASALIPYHLAEALPEPPGCGLARPSGLVIGMIPGAESAPVEVARLLWSGEDGRPLGWSRLPVRGAGLVAVPFESSPELGRGRRWLRTDAGRPEGGEILSAALSAEFEGVAVRRLHRAEALALPELELI